MDKREQFAEVWKAQGYAMPYGDTSHYKFAERFYRIGLQAAQAAPGEAVAYVPYCFADCNNGVEGEYRVDQTQETPFDMADPEHWECRSLYTAPPPAPGWNAAIEAAAKVLESLADGARTMGEAEQWREAAARVGALAKEAK